jgi:hypothetical protein
MSQQRPDWWFKKQWRWRHNGAHGKIVRAWRVVNQLCDEPSLTEDAKHHLERAWEHLRLAKEEAWLRRVEEDGTIAKIERPSVDDLLTKALDNK